MLSFKIKNTLTVMLLGIMAGAASAQVVTEAEMTCYKLSDQKIRIVATLMDIEEYDAVANTEVAFYSLLDNSSVLLGTATTDMEGTAILDEVPFERLLVDSTHRFYISYAIADSTYYVAGGERLAIQDVRMLISFEEIDSVKQVVVQIITWNDQGEEVFVEDMDAYLYVPRLFSLLPIGEIYTEEAGIGMMPFPDGLPGDEDGVVTVIARIEDSEEYGNVEVSGTVQWAVPVDGESSDLPRTLWSPRPPLWMVITFVILMAGVWFHYGWIVINMLGIRSEGRKEEL